MKTISSNQSFRSGRQRNRAVASLLALAACAGMTAAAQPAAVPHEIAPIKAPFPMPQLERPVFPDRTFDIRDYGAEEAGGGAKAKCTAAIHEAIEAAHQAGGGRVLVPAGEWLTGPIHLLSHVNLHFAEGAAVRFSEDREDYLPVVRQRYEGVEVYNYSPLIYAHRVKNAAVTGAGILDGRGKFWWEWSTRQNRAEATRVPLSRRLWGKAAGVEGMRPNFLVFWQSENVLVEGITLKDGPMWNVHLVYTTNAIVRGVTVNSLEAPNGDGVVVDSSKNVLLEYNTLKTGDDAVVLKSGLNEEGLQINIPTENVVVRHYSAIDVRTGSGGVVFGSETSGGIRNVYVHDAHFEGSDRGIRFKTERGRGNATENIYIRDITMKNITREAINFNTFYTGPGLVGPSPAFRNIEIRNIRIDGARSGIVLVGLPELWLENLTLKNITVENVREGIRVTRVKNLTLDDVTIRSEARAMIVEDAYELTLRKVALHDQTGGAPLLFKGRHTGAVFTEDFPSDRIEFADGLTKEIVQADRPAPAW